MPMMQPLNIVVSVLALILTGVAIYTTVKISTLHLPISPLLPVLTPLLPVLLALVTNFSQSHPSVAAASSTPSDRRLPSGNNQNHQQLIRKPVPQRSSNQPLFRMMGLPPAILTVLATVQMTLAASALPSAPTSCLLSTRWQSWWSSKSTVIRAVQDGLNCCGFNSVVDRSWPFPEHKPGAKFTCAEQFLRSAPCHPLWSAELRRQAVTMLVIGASVGALHLIHRVGVGGSVFDEPLLGTAFRWMNDSTRRADGGAAGDPGRRRLIADGALEDEDTLEPYRDEEEAVGNGTSGRPGVGAAGGAGTTHRIEPAGTEDAGPRLQPSMVGEHHVEPNHWNT